MPETSPADTQVATAGPSGLLCERVSVTFGATRALRDVSVHVAPGEILGLMGHNGAGKSTLLKVGTGVVTPDSGRVVVNGKPASRFGDPRHFFDLGVTVIHQEPALAPNLSILDNLTLGQSAVLDDRRKAAHRAAEIVRELELYRPLNTPVGVLSLGERQIVDLARGLLRGEIRALLLDEPAAALGVDETRILHGRIKELAASGTAVVYVSHRLPDILDVCDRILVLRDGQVAMEAPRSHFTARSLATAIAPGLAESSAKPSGIKPAGPPLAAMRRGEHELTVSAGEVVGLFGVAGGPQFDILDCLFGTGTALDEVTLNGHLYAPRGPVEAIASGVHLVPADRETDGLISGMSAIDNVFLPWVRSRKGVTPVSVAARRARYREIREDLGIRGPDGNAAISSFSGGNRQKHLLARWISVREPRLLLLAQPTQGVDEGAKFDIRKAIRRLSEAGGTVLVASAESDEVSSLCDRAYVFGPRGIHHVEASARFDETMLEMVSGEQDHHE